MTEGERRRRTPWQWVKDDLAKMNGPRTVVRTIARYPQILLQGLVAVVLGLVALAIASLIAGNWSILADDAVVAFVFGGLRVGQIVHGINSVRAD